MSKKPKNQCSNASCKNPADPAYVVNRRTYCSRECLEAAVRRETVSECREAGENNRGEATGQRKGLRVF